MNGLWVLLIVPVLALILARMNFKRVLKMPEGTKEMQEVAKAIRIGANTFINHEYKMIAIYVVLIGIILSVIIDW